MTNRMTNVNALELAIATLSTIEGFDTEAISKLGNIKASYEKKSHTDRKPTATQLDNERLKVAILDLMEVDRLYTVTEIGKLIEGDYSNQKLSALMNALFKADKVDKVVDKRKSYFKIKA